jgi:hypothetical protein
LGGSNDDIIISKPVHTHPPASLRSSETALLLVAITLINTIHTVAVPFFYQTIQIQRSFISLRLRGCYQPNGRVRLKKLKEDI